MLVETVWERKSSMALKTKIEAVVMAKISNANHAYLAYALEVWTYFHPCNEVSWKKAVPKHFSFSKWNKLKTHYQYKSCRCPKFDSHAMQTLEIRVEQKKDI